MENDVQIDAQWFPREANLSADLLSRFVDKDDWSLNPEVFAQLVCKWDLTTMLRFQDLILISCLRAVAPSMPFPWIAEAEIIGFALLFSWMWK